MAFGRRQRIGTGTGGGRRCSGRRHGGRGLIAVQHVAFAEQRDDQRLQLAELRLEVDALARQLIDVTLAFVRPQPHRRALLLIQSYVLT